MTNADRIRAMTTEQLSRFLFNPFPTYVPCRYSCDKTEYSYECRKCIEDWLNQECKEIQVQKRTADQDDDVAQGGAS